MSSRPDESKSPESRPGGSDFPAAERRDAIARLLAQYDRWLYAFLVSNVGNAADAEEVFQETCVIIWRECEAFELGTNFPAWAATIARNQVHRFRRDRKKMGHQLSDAALELVSADAVQRADLLQLRRDALRQCLQKLNERDRTLVQQCYGDTQATLKSVAGRIGRPVNTVYKALRRVRQVLHGCIQRTLTAEGVL